MKIFIEFIKKEIIFVIFFCLMLFSIFLIPLDKEYLKYIDYKTLIVLYVFMLVIEGLKESLIFELILMYIFKISKNLYILSVLLVLSVFFLAMLITNDVVLILFVPFTIQIFNKLKMKKYIIDIIILETISANLGSMLTPIGNPQNLYLYILSNIEFIKFIKLMFPYTLLAFVIINIFLIILFSNKILINIDYNNCIKIKYDYLFWLVLSILSVFKIVDIYLVFLLINIYVFVNNKYLLRKIDYMLLLTFVVFFVFSSNISRYFTNIISIAGNELLYSIVCSQFISNVPVAILLSKFTTKYELLIIGTNLGGLGTIIASMASLISYKQVENKRKYLFKFSMYNIVFLVIYVVFFNMR